MNKQVWILSLCQALLTTGNIVLISVTALIGQSLAPTPSLVTLPVAIQFIGMMCATIPASLIMARIGRKRGFTLGNMIGIAGAACCIYALWLVNFYLFSVGTFLLGIGIGFGTLYRFAAMELCDAKYHSRAISISMAGGVLAAILGPFLAVQSREWLSSDLSFIGPFIGVLLLYVLSLCLLQVVALPVDRHQTATKKGRRLTQLLTQSNYLLAVASGAVAYSVMILLMTVTPLAMMGCGYSFEQSTQVIQWHVLGMFVPSFFTGHLIDRIGAKNTILLGAVFMLMCCIVNLTGTTLIQFNIALILLGVGWNFMFIAATRFLTMTYQPEDKPKAQACNEFVVFSSVTIASLLAGWLNTTIGWYQLNLVTIPFMLVIIAALFIFKPQLKPSLQHK
ncbi:MFS transporter [Photobacterium leiognathi]|uniref:MFS transporter n=1 Tax=Photobacterium leiognathi TaxID=553611 RepID=UPI002732B306|nr:MFS transporter [Photobacterium leiognathi]